VYAYTYRPAIYLLPFNALQAQSFANGAPTRTTNFALSTLEAKGNEENIHRCEIRPNSKFVDK